MKETTRQLVAEEMIRDWLMVYSMLPATAGYTFHGTAAAAVADFETRHNIRLVGHRLVMDDGDWTIRGTFANGSVAMIFAS